MTPKPISDNTLFYGDNLPILREYIPDESVDLVYLDPPFNSNRSYNVLFKDETGQDSESQIVAFDDTWHWGRCRRADVSRTCDRRAGQRRGHDRRAAPVHRRQPDDGLPGDDGHPAW